MIDFKPVIFVNGILLLILALAMGVPALVDAASGDRDWAVFALSALVTGFIGMGMALGARPDQRQPLNTRQAFLLTSSTWFLLSAFAALPFIFSALNLSVADGVFEAVSGFTTTGSTVIVGLDHAPKGILIWRALLNWLGGLGIIVMAVAILPILRIGGMQLFKMESSDKSDKVKPRIAQVAMSIATVYLTFTVLAALAMWATGMTVFEAICHSFAALGTGGFSTSDSSLGNWSTATQWVTIAAMLVGGTTFTLYISPWKHGRWPFVHDSQIRWYLGFLGSFAALLAFWQWAFNDMEPGDALTHATFNVVSVVTTTGFATTDYNAWGGFAQVVFFILTFIGGCTGSTAGGVKIFRWEVLFKLAGIHLKRLLHPHGIFAIDFNKRRIPKAVVDSVLGFMTVYFLTFALFALALTAVNMDLISALSGSAQALSNVGPGLGPIIGPAGNFKSIPEAAKWIMAFEMILGRLELFSVIVLFTRSFWRA
ncbi:MAG: TrkH family potassium uptake protein [Rhodospirillaceae bacterium]|nr:TrkH family potassium uptake protein [Rhodospirillales bacterium]